MKLANLILIFLCGSATAKKNYNNYKVAKFDRNSFEQLQDNYDIWSSNLKTVNVLVSPEEFESLEMKFGDLQIVVDNVQSLLDFESEAIKETSMKQNSFFETYHTYEEIQTFITETNSNYDHVTIESIGKTYEGRDITLVKICDDGECGNDPALYIECNIHAREWVTAASCLYLINELTAKREENADYLDGLDWYIIPLLNADGYAYSWEEDRLWRKTRTPSPDSNCSGVDGNRNWDDHFRFDGGASDDPCSIVYRGPSPFSEPCTKAASDFVWAHKDEIVYFQDLHAYSQYVMYPFGYTLDPCEDCGKMQDLANRGVVAMYKEDGRSYTTGPWAQMLYYGSGVSTDWAYNVAGIKYSYCIESRPSEPEANTMDSGFILPPDEIVPNAKEIWAFHKVVAMEMKSGARPLKGASFVTLTALLTLYAGRK